MLMQSSQELSFVAKCGLSWNFVPGTPQEIPTKLVSEAITHGLQAVDPKANEQAVEQVAAEKEAAVARVPTIEDAIRKMVKRNLRGDFTAGGRPNLNALFRLSQQELTSEELDPIWNKIKKEFE